MKNKNKISVTIITGNEDENILECLESVKWADEIIMVDSESTDKTVEIAKTFTERVFIRKWEGYAPQKNFAMEQAANEWVLSIDADERVTKELSEEILTLNFEDYDGFKIKRDNFFYW
jgi:(heptosyl)LPS beta-1,4-glucosyltransferase